MRALGASRTSLVPGGVLAGPWVRNDLWRRARAVPSLDLRFADNKSLTDAVTGASLVTFTRAGSGTYTDSAGVLQTAGTDAPRFDHNPTTGESLGLLVEEARTNLCLYSQAISTAPWAANGTETCVANTLIDPAGALNAFKINLEASSFSRWQQPITVVNGTTYTLSAWVRSTTSTTLFRLRFAGGFTSSDLTATTTWQRFTYTLTAGTTAGFFAFNSPSTGAATEIHVYGAQLEAGAFPTSYIPTTTAAATRSADVPSVTGANFSSWYNQTEGTVFSDAAVSYTVPGSAFPVVVGLGDGTASNKIVNGYLTSAVAGFEVSAGGVGQAGIYLSTASANRKLASCYRLNDFAASVNGGTVGTDTSGTVPTVDRLGINAVTGYNALNGTIRRLTYWGQRLPNNILQGITQ